MQNKLMSLLHNNALDQGKYIQRRQSKNQDTLKSFMKKWLGNSETSLKSFLGQAIICVGSVSVSLHITHAHIQGVKVRKETPVVSLLCMEWRQGNRAQNSRLLPRNLFVGLFQRDANK